MSTVNLVGFIVGLVVGILVLTICCPLCIILGIVACVVAAFRRQKRVDRELRSKNVPISSGGLFGSSVAAAPSTSVASAPSNVVYTKDGEKVDNVWQRQDKNYKQLWHFISQQLLYMYKIILYICKLFSKLKLLCHLLIFYITTVTVTVHVQNHLTFLYANFQIYLIISMVL